jgi:hypothetical protein
VGCVEEAIVCGVAGYVGDVCGGDVGQGVGGGVEEVSGYRVVLFSVSQVCSWI